MKTFAFTIFLVLSLVGGFNLFVDVENKFWRSSDRFPAIPNDQVLVVPGNRNERQDRIKFLNSASSADILILGSSKALRWGQAETGLKSSLLNLAVSTASIEELAALYEAALKKGFKFKTLILSLDPWMMNENVQGYDASWLEDTEWFQDFRRRVLHDSSESWSKKWSVKIKSAIEDLKSLVSAARLTASIRSTQNLGWNSPSQYQLKTETEKGDTHYAIKSDGALLYPKKYLEQTQDEVDHQASEYPSVATDYLFRKFSVSAEKEKILKSMIEDAKAQGVSVVVISSAFHPASYRRLIEMPMYKDAMIYWSQFLQGLVPTVKVCDFTDPSRSSCGTADFSDGMHMKPACITAIFSRCFKDEPSAH